MGKIITAEETERKYILQSFSKDVIWDREFVIYQWYDTSDPEMKTKVIFDLVNLYQKWVRVKKERTSSSHSNKTIEYLTPECINLTDFLGMQFVSKRRSVKGKICVDTFLRSNDKCFIMLENEGDNSLLDEVASKYNMKLEDVTENPNYRNTNLTTSFSEEDLSQLKLLISIIHK